jgi:hypothetical protein
MSERNLMSLSYRNLQPLYAAVFLSACSWREGAATHTRGIMKNNNKVVDKKTPMNPKDDKARAYMLVEIQPGKEKEFGDEILSRGLLIDSKVERMDFVHGPFDFVIIVHGEMEDIDAKLMEIRKSAFVRKTSTLICFEMFDLVDISDRVKEQS